MESLNTHNTPQVLYDALAGQFGEQISTQRDHETRWVSIGCGSVLLTFFAPRPGGPRDVSVTLPETPTFKTVDPA
jgi:hypothetical protein